MKFVAILADGYVISDKFHGAKFYKISYDLRYVFCKPIGEILRTRPNCMHKFRRQIILWRKFLRTESLAKFKPTRLSLASPPAKISFAQNFIWVKLKFQPKLRLSRLASARNFKPELVAVFFHYKKPDAKAAVTFVKAGVKLKNMR